MKEQIAIIGDNKLGGLAGGIATYLLIKRYAAKSHPLYPIAACGIIVLGVVFGAHFQKGIEKKQNKSETSISGMLRK